MGCELFKWVVLASCLLLVAAQDNDAVEYDVMEEMAPNTFIGNTARGAGLDVKYSESVYNSLSFKILSASDNKVNLFTLEGSSGILRTSQTIDREAICPRAITCDIHLDILVQPVDYFNVIKVIIHIIDKNDNTPTFPAALVERSLTETSRPGTIIPIPIAQDEDSGTYGIQRYRLIPSNSKFFLQVTNTSDGSTDLHIVLRERLDRELQDSYSLQVMAYDGGTPPKSSAIEIIVTVKDANDNSPVFEVETYTVTIPEDQPIYSTIVKVKAVDKDAGSNGEVLYSFAESTMESHGKTFAINNKTGEIYTTAKLDFETMTNPVYYLNVKGQDQGQNAIPGYAKVVVTLRDINDYSPEITVNTLTSTDTANIMEGASKGTFVAHVSVADKDSGDNGKVSCHINNVDFNLVQLFDREYKLTTNTVFDRETNQGIAVIIECEDGGFPSLVSSKEIKVQVLDFNDHAPQFSKIEYRIFVPENSSAHTPLLQVNASDKDLGDNAKIVYSIVGKEGESDLLYINQNTGVISANVKFDFEYKKEYDFMLIAEDSGDNTNSATAVLKVLIQDTNDEAPIFEEKFYSFGTFENEPVGTTIGTVSAIDKDNPPFNEVTYKIKYNTTDLDYFSINPVTGKIKVKRQLDREERGSYDLTVIACNMGYPKMSNEINVTVYVADRNDNSPVMDFPTRGNNTIYISSYMVNRNMVAKIRARDFDVGYNSDLSYSIIQGNEDRAFILENATGILKVVKDLNDNMPDEFTFKIEVRDAGSPSLFAIETLHIFVNKTAPAFGAPFTGWMGSPTSFIIIVIIAIALVLVVVLLTAIIIVKRRNRNNKAKPMYTLRPSMRLEAQNMLQLHSQGSSSSSKESIEMSENKPECPPSPEVIKHKKEVSFSMDIEKPKKLWNGIDHVIQNPQVQNSFNGYPRVQNNYVDLDADNNPPTYHDHMHSLHNRQDFTPPPSAGRYNNNTLTDIEVEVDNMLKMLNCDRDSVSGGSSGSYPDSGRGPSEEGDTLPKDSPHKPPIHYNRGFSVDKPHRKRPPSHQRLKPKVPAKPKPPPPPREGCYRGPGSPLKIMRTLSEQTEPDRYDQRPFACVQPNIPNERQTLSRSNSFQGYTGPTSQTRSHHPVPNRSYSGEGATEWGHYGSQPIFKRQPSHPQGPPPPLRQCIKDVVGQYMPPRPPRGVAMGMQDNVSECDMSSTSGSYVVDLDHGEDLNKICVV